MTRLLVVDDNAAVRLVLRTKFEALGWDVDDAASGEEALASFQLAQPDMVVLDQRMAGLTGLEVACRLRDQGFPGQLVLYSAYLTPELESEAEASGIVTVSKTDFADLVTVLRMAAAGRLPRPPAS